MLRAIVTGRSQCKYPSQSMVFMCGAGDLALYAARLVGGDPGRLTVTAMPSPALGTQLLTTSGGPAVYAPVAQAAQVGPHCLGFGVGSVHPASLAGSQVVDLRIAMQRDGIMGLAHTFVMQRPKHMCAATASRACCDLRTVPAVHVVQPHARHAGDHPGEAALRTHPGPAISLRRKCVSACRHASGRSCHCVGWRMRPSACSGH